MELFGMEKLSLVDYDGKVAATVFTGGCNFKCGFCHNGPLIADFNDIKTVSEGEVIEYLNKRKGIIDGVCITGGEPTLHPDLPYFCEKLKNAGVSVKVDTNGTNPQMIKVLAENSLADYFAMDIKNSKENYAEIIGFKSFDTSKIEESVNYFLNGNADYEFRTTLIKEYHGKEDIKKIGEWIKGAKKYFLQKFKDVESCPSHDLSAVEKELAEEFIAVLKPYIPAAKLRGY